MFLALFLLLCWQIVPHDFYSWFLDFFRRLAPFISPKKSIISALKLTVEVVSKCTINRCKYHYFSGNKRQLVKSKPNLIKNLKQWYRAGSRTSSWQGVVHLASSVLRGLILTLLDKLFLTFFMLDYFLNSQYTLKKIISLTDKCVNIFKNRATDNGKRLFEK